MKKHVNRGTAEKAQLPPRAPSCAIIHTVDGLLPALAMSLLVFIGMRERSLTIPEIALIGGTRVALGIGIGLLIAGKFNDDQREGAGWALFAVGAISTIPLVIGILGK